MPVPLFSSGWWLGALAAAMVGVAKTGVPGFGVLAVPLMVLAAGDARNAAGWLLPILCVADLFAVRYYRHHANLRQVIGLFPWVGLGMVAGALALGMADRPLQYLVASLILVMLLLRVRARFRATPPAPPGLVQSAAFGATAGFATTLSNAAGPVMNLYLLGRRLPKPEFMAIQAWFFFIINLTKLPIYGARGMFSAASLLLDLTWLPVVAGGALCGRALLTRVPQRTFELAVLALTALATLLLFLR